MHRNVKYNVNNNLYSTEDFLKDCPNSEFVPLVLPPVKRIIAMGDIHGDFNLAVNFFKLASLINNQMEWIAQPPDTIVVQVGDQIDSCRPCTNNNCQSQKYPGDFADDITVVNFFKEMHTKAKKHGGAVYSLLGNHELMNSQGKFDYVSFENYHNFVYDSIDGKKYTGPNGRKKAFKPGGPLAKIFACERQSVLIIGSTMFVHAGVLPVLTQKLDHLNLDNNTKLKYLNSIVRKWLLAKLSTKTDLENKDLLISNKENSPFWTRLYGTIPVNSTLDSSTCFETVKKTLQVFKIGKIVVGHTPQQYTNKTGINGTCYEKNNENVLYRIDGGFSHAFDIFGKTNQIQVLEIIDDKDFNIITGQRS